MLKRNVLLAILLSICLAFLVVPLASGQGVNNAELKGDYAFSFNGMTTGGGGNSTPFGAVGRFTEDGAGNLTNGELDANGFGMAFGVGEKAVAQAFTGTYSIGADHRGIMSLNIPGGGTLAFAMMTNGNAKFVEVDASGGTAQSAPAPLRKRTPQLTAQQKLWVTMRLALPASTSRITELQWLVALPQTDQAWPITEPPTSISQGTSPP